MTYGMIDDGTRAALVLTAELVRVGVLTQEQREQIDDRLLAVWEIRSSERGTRS